MQFNSTKWVASVKSAIEKTLKSRPTANLNGAVGTVVYLRDSLLAELAEHPDDGAWTTTDVRQFVTEEMNDLVANMRERNTDGSFKVELNGFGGNISAAAKAAGYKSTSPLDEFGAV